MNLSNDSFILKKFIDRKLNFINIPEYRVIQLLYDYFTSNYNHIVEKIEYTIQEINIDENKKNFTEILDELYNDIINKTIIVSIASVTNLVDETIEEVEEYNQVGHLDKPSVKHFLNFKVKNFSRRKILKWFEKQVGKKIIYEIATDFYQNKLNIKLKNLISNFTPMEIVYLVEDNDLTNIYQYESNYLTNLCSITIICMNEPEPEDTLIKRLFAKTFLLLQIREYKNIKIKIKIWLTNHKKIIDTKIDCLGIKNINSGYTTLNNFNKNGNIFVFRKEEVEKVFIHELIHALNFDFREYPKEFKNELYNIFSIPKYNIHKINNLLLGEAYVETWACIINCILVSYLTNENFNELFKEEVKFSIFQFAKVLNFFNFSCLEGCENSFINQEKTKFKQRTAVFSYYIIKCMLLYNFEDFLEMCIEGNDNLMIFKEINFPKLHNIILKSIEDPVFKNNINTTIQFIKKNKKNSFEYNTMRMTISELEI